MCGLLSSLLFLSITLFLCRLFMIIHMAVDCIKLQGTLFICLVVLPGLYPVYIHKLIVLNLDSSEIERGSHVSIRERRELVRVLGRVRDGPRPLFLSHAAAGGAARRPVRHRHGARWGAGGERASAKTRGAKRDSGELGAEDREPGRSRCRSLS